MAKSLAIHVPPDSNPTNIWAMIFQLSKDSNSKFDTAKELIEYLRDSGQSTSDWVYSTASDLGILERTDEGIQLSANGLALAKMRADVRQDMLHFLIYTGWSAKRPTEFLQSWAYRMVCNQYWELGTTELTNDYLDRQVAQIIDLAQTVFSAMEVGDFSEISFSRKSIRGALNWMEAVSPSVIENKTFSRRSFCPPELLVMAIGHILQDEANIIGIDILLTPEKREAIGKICLLEPDNLDRVLDWALPIFSNLIAPGTTAGFYGRFIRLHRLPTLQDMVR